MQSRGMKKMVSLLLLRHGEQRRKALLRALEEQVYDRLIVHGSHFLSVLTHLLPKQDRKSH